MVRPSKAQMSPPCDRDRTYCAVPGTRQFRHVSSVLSTAVRECVSRLLSALGAGWGVRAYVLARDSIVTRRRGPPVLLLSSGSTSK